MWSNGKPHISPENKGEEHFFCFFFNTGKGEFRGAVVNSPLEEIGSLKCSGFSLAEL